MDKMYTYSFDLNTNTVKVREGPVIRETDLTYTFKNFIGLEVRIRKAALGKLDSMCIMHLDRMDEKFYLHELIEHQKRSIMTLNRMTHNAVERLEKMEELMEEAE